MAHSLSIKSGDDQVTVFLTHADLDYLHSLWGASDGFKSLMNVVFGQDAPGESRMVTRDELVHAIDEISRAIEQGGSLPSYRYTFKVSFPPGFPAGTCRQIGGLIIDGKLFFAEAGIDQCELIEVLPDGLGGGRHGARKDVRAVRRIHTSNMGELIVCRTRRKPKTVVQFRKLAAFLSRVPQERLVEVAFA